MDRLLRVSTSMRPSSSTGGAQRRGWTQRSAKMSL